MDYLSLIKQPISRDLDDFIALFNESLTYDDGLLGSALAHIRQRGGKRMRPMLILLSAKNYGQVSAITQHAAVGLELLHTASLVHDDVVDESSERRGQASVNATYNNKVAVLVGDYILSTALLHVAKTGERRIVEYLAQLGRTLAAGEILQLSNIQNQVISEDVYYQIIKNKTAALFEACAAIGALSVGASEEEVMKAGKFGQDLGIMFQIRDDIFDYYELPQLGKPTGNDMAEGKLTLPTIHVVLTSGNEEALSIAKRVKAFEATKEDIAKLIDFTKKNGGIEYAEEVMLRLHDEALQFIEKRVGNETIKSSLTTYLNYCIKRTL
jgi:octaprenyl-diphosphate synthase